MRSWKIVMAIIGVLFVQTGSAWACSCIIPPPASEELANATAVFAGTVVEQKARQGLTISSADPIKVTFAVAEVWKGEIPAEVRITTARDSASCGYNFEDGKDYLVYASGTSDALNVSLCSRTSLLATADADLQELGPGAPPTAIMESETGGKMQPIAIYALSTIGFLLFAAVVYLAQRSNKKKS